MYFFFSFLLNLFYFISGVWFVDAGLEVGVLVEETAGQWVGAGGDNQYGDVFIPDTC